MLFYLGTHQPGWLRQTSVPLFVSTRRLSRYKSLRSSLAPLAIDSNGYSELNAPPHRWTITPQRYAADVRHYAAAFGQVAWAAIQDWMCEPWILSKTGLSIREHQARTVASLLELRSLAPEIHWTPVLQGWQLEDYLRHVDDYARAGVELDQEPVVGLGSVCRRQATAAIVSIAQTLAGLGIKLHGFGIKKLGLPRLAPYLVSADSMAWSFDARRLRRPVCGSRRHKNCANCLVFALRWRQDLLAMLTPRQSSWQQLRLWA